VGLWARLTSAFLLVVALLGGATIYTGATLINSTVRREAQRRTELDLRAARAQLDSRLETLRLTLEHIARSPHARLAALGNATDDDRVGLERHRLRYRLDVLSVCDGRGRVTLRTRHPYKPGGTRATDPLVSRALRGEAAAGIVLLYPDELAAEGSDLPQAAYVHFVPTPRAKPRPEEEERRGMMLWAAAPVADQQGKTIGALYGGILLTRNWEVVDTIRDIVFGDETYGGKPLGTVTIFLWDARVTTNVQDARGNRAIGTRVSEEVYDSVLENGRRWHERAFVVDAWYISAYEPIRDPTRKTIGILYTGVLERKYTDIRNRVLRSFIIPVCLAIGISVALAFVLVRSIVRPVGELVVASQRLARGELDHRPRKVRSSPELARLVEAFNQMADAIAQRDEQLRKQNLELEASNEQLSQLNRSYMEMLGFVTHELKNPLNSVIFSAASLRDGYLGPLDEKQKEAADRIHRNAKYLEEMIANYLSLSRIEKGELVANPAAVNLSADVVQPIVAQLKAQFEEAGMALEVEVPADLALTADPALLRIALDNLLTNAAKYGRRGGRVRVRAAEHDGTVRLSVWNEGEGIKPENLPKLFGKFVRLEQETTKARKGTGLGLFICREIAQRHGGRIWAESEYGKWAEFTIEIPTQQPESAA